MKATGHGQYACSYNEHGQLTSCSLVALPWDRRVCCIESIRSPLLVRSEPCFFSEPISRAEDSMDTPSLSNVFIEIIK